MTHYKFLSGLIVSGAVMVLTACGGSDTNQASQSAVEKTTESVKTVEAEAPKTDTAAPGKVAELTSGEALLKRGRVVWFKCRSCHELAVDGRHKVGPNLHALMGTEAGIKEGFVFSEALKTSDIVWTEETLDKFIEKPSAYVKGTKMAFVGIKKESDRQAVIAYIQENAKPAE